MTEQDGFRIEAALQFGFKMTNDDGDEYACTEAQLLAFAKASEHASALRSLNETHPTTKARIAQLETEFQPLLDREQERSMEEQGYVKVGIPVIVGRQHWAKPAPGMACQLQAASRAAGDTPGASESGGGLTDSELTEAAIRQAAADQFRKGYELDMTIGRALEQIADAMVELKRAAGDTP